MSEGTTAVQEAEVVDGNKKESPSAATPPAVSPAQDLREIQALLVNGIFPGNVAPQVVKAFQLLERMASQVEANATK